MCVDFGNLFGVFGYYYEVDDYEDCEYYYFDYVVVVDYYFVEGLDYFVCGVMVVVVVE